MQKVLARVVGWRLQYILVAAFVLTSAITIVFGAAIIYGLIRSYLDDAQNERVSRDMDLAEAFYSSKQADISATARRIAAWRGLRTNLRAASQGDLAAMEIVEEAIAVETAHLAADAQRFIVVTDPSGRSVDGQVVRNGRRTPVKIGADWSQLPILGSALSHREFVSGAEVVPARPLQWVGLESQALIELLETPRAAPRPFDPREGTAGLVLVSVAPVFADDGRVAGTIVVGHLLNNDFTLVDRIKEVAGVDTVTIFFGDLRVSTNVLNEQGERAIGTRLSQEVYDRVLVEGKEFTGPAYVVNQWYITRYEPLHDHQGKVVGILYVGAKQASFQQLVESFGRRVLFITVSCILIALLTGIPLAWSITRPLTGVAEATRKVAQGDWSVRVPVYGRGEIGILAESFNTMVETLNDTHDQLLQKEKLASVGQLAAGVAHEINNPLGSVLLYADILRKETPPDNTQQLEDLQMIMREATRCKTIVNDLLNFSRQNEVLAQETDLNELLQELVEESRKLELYKQVKLVTKLDPELSPVQADPLQLRQAVVNLMNNAAEAMPQGGTLTLCTRPASMPGYVIIEVADTGVGISEENMRKLFTPFFTTKPIGKGTGLGLAIIYGIVKMHRGQISVQSEAGKGTTFTIMLREQLPQQAEPVDLIS